MTQTAKNPINSRIENGKVLVLDRVFKAPRDLVFEAFTTAEHLSKWWGPRGWDMPHCTVDLRPGGKWHYCMKCVDPNQGQFYGMESWGLGVYQEIEAPARLVYTDHFSDAQATINENMPATLSTLTFEEVEGGTKVTTRAEYDTEEALKTVMDMGMLQGITETWDRLAEHLAAAQD
ncbi:SRPBCC domain-containing protein [Deinococcus cellulosilyticus]|uniref:Activator of HSP90 ATPase n=1 Tax=Deinococcus cellulosilyticus (strain DSM 18568 / NBRC 106333 / KACC 11606 / 5516J-15) TaxID=1223518 RepID=A0A511N9S0_DEIC1|nr:SRPBCC domain-containing protein [Deinococcus cellulosilyticus]GEM49266.1 activator of HSP90 ATPase [Deinococcus cellulosilyticus NBRC 106333 = KACC 11606]